MLLVIFAGGILARAVPVRELGYEQRAYSGNAGELTGEAIFGQTFRAERDNLSGIAVKFATYSGRDNAKPVFFHLRNSVDDAADLRTASVLASQLGDNQFHVFRFAPVRDSAGRTFFFFVGSPESEPGDAITVDLDVRDPYHFGSAYLMRGSGVDDPPALHASGKRSVDLSFALNYSVPLRTAAVHKTYALARTVRQLWREPPAPYVAALKTAIVAFVFGVLFVVFNVRRAVSHRWVLGGLFVGAMIVRLMYARELPATFDEGNYLYDARALWDGKLAGGDGYVKAPLVIGWMALWQLGGHSLIVGRFSSIVMGALTVFVVYALGRELGRRFGFGRRAGLLAAAAWALFGVTTVFTIYVHTQPVALFFGGLAVAVLLAALRRRASLRVFVLVGVWLGLGVISRKSILALGLLPLVFILIESASWPLRIKRLLAVGLGFLAVAAVLLSAAGLVYGAEGFWEALGANSAEDGLTGVDPAELEQVRAYSIRGMTPFFREALPLIFLAVLGWGLVLERAAARAVPSQFLRLVWIGPLAAFWWAWQFFLEHEGEAVMVFSMRAMWYAMAGVLMAVMLLRGSVRHEENSSRRAQWTAALIGPLWVGGLAVFYMNWIKFHANYLGEFLLPLVLLAGLGAAAAWERLRSFQWRLVREMSLGVFTVVLLWAVFASGYVTYVFEHTGTYELSALDEAARWTSDHVPRNEPIFTGAALVPYLSGHRVSLDIAHPRWYAYEFTRKDPQRLNTFLPSAEEMRTAFGEAQWVLLDDQTHFSFMMEYEDIKQSLAEDFKRVHGISNGSNTLTFYRRLQP